MKSIRNNPERTYPYIGICDLGIIVLFTAPLQGVVLHQKDNVKFGGDKEIGHYSEGIVESQFVMYDGTITLSN